MAGIYWNPTASPEEYGKPFKAVVPVIREADPAVKIVFVDACGCADSIDVFAYHIYPNYGHNLNPEAMDDQQHASESPKALRDMVRSYPGIRKECFWSSHATSAWEVRPAAHLRWRPWERDP